MRYPYEVRSEAQAFERIDEEKPDGKLLAVFLTSAGSTRFSQRPKGQLHVCFHQLWREQCQTCLQDLDRGAGGNEAAPIRYGPASRSGRRAARLWKTWASPSIPTPVIVQAIKVASGPAADVKF